MDPSEPTRADALREKASGLPARPGVYVFSDADGEVLYVGKAKSLRDRVRSYFADDPSRSLKGRTLVRRIHDLETFVLASEAEALLLEWNLIKEHEPRYNVQLRDDKSYPYVKVTVQEPFPRVLVTRRLERDGSRYFGPFTDVGAMRSALRKIKSIYHVRSCHYDMPRETPQRPCLDYHIGRCRAPCAGHQSQEDYRAAIDQVVEILAGHTDAVKGQVHDRMEAAADELDFERAAELRDVIRGLEGLERRRTTVDFRGGDRDALGFEVEGSTAWGVVLRVREGRLLGREVHTLHNVSETDPGQVAGAFVKGFYLRREDLPRELLVPNDFEDAALVEEYLSMRRKGPFRIHVPRRGRKRRLVELAADNAHHILSREPASMDLAPVDPSGDGAGSRPRASAGDDKAETGREARARRAAAVAQRLDDALGVGTGVRSLVCFDVSTLQGTDSVGSAVWLRSGRPDKSEYRRFRVRGTPEGTTDDYAMMQEIVGRYFHRRVREGAELPDLVVIDGGRGQLGAARQAMESAGVSDLPVVALAKREEEIFLPGRAGPVTLDRGDPALHWLQRARDEAHRFALAYNRKLRRRRTLRSRLSEIAGVGPAREQELLRRFGSLGAIRDAAPEELVKTPGVGEKTATRIQEALSENPDT